MRILLVNKFLYPNGGSETYMFNLGKYLQEMGHEVEYFGMADPKNICGNSLGCYAAGIKFDALNSLGRLWQSINIIYSRDAVKKIRKVIEGFKPDIVHMNNINYQLTPSIYYEIKRQSVPMVQTIHDSQIACPSHRLYIEKTGEICEKCISGSYINCMKHKCIKDSLPMSALASLESFLYHRLNTYNMVDAYICPSRFIAGIIERGGVRPSKIRVMYNFTSIQSKGKVKSDKQPYVLYFGRYSVEKGLKTLIKVCKSLPHIKFIFAGGGPLESMLLDMKNVINVGFKSGDELNNLISGAMFSVYPSECYENCPLSIMESQALGTPVIGSDLGGIKELIENKKDGIIFSNGNAGELKEVIKLLWDSPDLLSTMSLNCLKKGQGDIKKYCNKLLKIYQEITNGSKNT